MQEKKNLALEREMIRKEKELVAMQAQLLLKKSNLIKAKNKKLKEQAEENKKENLQGSSSARCKSRGSSRGTHRKKRPASGCTAPSARQSPVKNLNDKKETIYDVKDPLAMEPLQMPQGEIEGPGENFEWHTPKAVGSGKSAISSLRLSKYSPILNQQISAKDECLVSPGAVRLNSAERLAMACRREENVVIGRNPLDQNEDVTENKNISPSPMRSLSMHDVLSSSQQPPLRRLPRSPIECEEKVVSNNESIKLPSISPAQCLSEGKFKNKIKSIAGRGVLKNKFVNEKLANSPYGSFLAKHEHQPKQQQKHSSPQKINSEVTPQPILAPTTAFTAMNRPPCPSLQGVSVVAGVGASVKK